MGKWIWILVVLVVLVAGLGGGGFLVFQQMQTQNAEGEEGGGFRFTFGGGGDTGTPVRLEQVAVGDLVRTVSAPGSIEPRTLVRISSQVSAKILALPFQEGDLVQEGDVVVRLDPQNLVALLESARAQVRIEEARLDGAKADRINARLEYDRVQQLYETGDVPKAELEAAEARYLQAQSTLKAIEASIEVAKAGITRVEKDIDNTVITSPIDGTVTALYTEVGETAIAGTTNTPGSLMMEIADRAEMLLKAQIDETNIAPIAEGQAATVYINAYEDREYRGIVEKIGLKRQVSASGTGFFEVEIALELAEGERLLNGLTASTDIEVERFFDVVKVPSQAVVERKVEDLPRDIRTSEFVDRDKTYANVVYEFVDGKAVARPVEVGPSDLRDTLIMGGLDAGATIVVGPFRVLENLKHDQALRDEAAVDEDDAEGGEADTENGEGTDGTESETDEGEAESDEAAPANAAAESEEASG